MNNRLQKYLDSKYLLSTNQNKFRPGVSTEDADKELADYLMSNMDKDHKCIGVFVDLAKAFDTVSGKILIRKLGLIYIRGLFLEWFKLLKVIYVTENRE